MEQLLHQLSFVNADWAFWFPVKLLLAFILGSVLGMERTTKQPIAGVRTHMIVSCGSCLISACGADLVHYAGAGSGDATRLAGQILAGIGFIGAGAIISRGVGVMTTAATIFFAAGVGIACGLSFFAFAIIATIVIVIGLQLSEKFFPQEEILGKNLRIVCVKDKVDEVRKMFGGNARLNSVVKREDSIELGLHFVDLSWVELDKLVNRAAEDPNVIAIQIGEVRGGL